MSTVKTTQTAVTPRGRAQAFYAIARRRGETFHVTRRKVAAPTSARLRHYLRIERGIFA